MNVQTRHGVIGFAGWGSLGNRTLRLTLPPGAAGELVVPAEDKLALPTLGRGRFRLPAGEAITLTLRRC